MKVEIILICVVVVTIHAARIVGRPERIADALPVPADCKSNKIQETVDFLKQGERVLKLDDNYRDVIMMVGNTATVKSTLTQFVAGCTTAIAFSHQLIIYVFSPFRLIGWEKEMKQNVDGAYRQRWDAVFSTSTQNMRFIRKSSTGIILPK